MGHMGFYTKGLVDGVKAVYTPDTAPANGITFGRVKRAVKRACKRCLVVAAAVSAVSMAIGACTAPDHGTYATVLVVDSVDRETGRVVYRDSHGFRRAVVQDDMDVDIGEAYAVIMDDNGTKHISDDKIVSMRYMRLDLLEEVADDAR